VWILNLSLCDYFSVNSRHLNQRKSFVLVMGHFWVAQVGAGRPECCIWLLYSNPSPGRLEDQPPMPGLSSARTWARAVERGHSWTETSSAWAKRTRCGIWFRSG
jgi:hypothetical protein